MALIITVIIVALIFEYINGFHDTANSIATVVSTKVLTPRQAVVLAAVTNLFGAMVGTAGQPVARRCIPRAATWKFTTAFSRTTWRWARWPEKPGSGAGSWDSMDIPEWPVMQSAAR